MTWEEMSRDSLRAAQRMLAEGYLRSAVSRAYYAAYCAATGRTAQRRSSFAHGRNNPSHEEIRGLLRTHGGLPVHVRQQLIRAVTRLRHAREDADYRPLVTVDRDTALAAVRDAMLIMRALGVADD